MFPKAEVTRQRIIEAAADLMGTQGYGRTALEAILERCAVSKGNFYHHFPSKEELGLAVLSFLGACTQARIHRRMAAHQDPLDRVDALLDAIVEGAGRRQGRGGCPLGNLAAEMSDLHEGFRARLGGIFRVWAELVAQNLREAARRRHRRDLDAEGLARHLVSALEGSILMAKVTRQVDELDNSVTHLKSYVRKVLSQQAEAI